MFDPSPHPNNKILCFLSVPIGLAMEQALIIVIIIYVYIPVCTDYGLFHTHDYN